MLPVAVGTDTVSPILPIIKITGSTSYFHQKENRIDFNAGTLLNGKENVMQAKKMLLKMIRAVASGKVTRTEKGQDFFLNIPVQFHQA